MRRIIKRIVINVSPNGGGRADRPLLSRLLALPAILGAALALTMMLSALLALLLVPGSLIALLAWRALRKPAPGPDAPADGGSLEGEYTVIDKPREK